MPVIGKKGCSGTEPESGIKRLNAMSEGDPCGEYAAVQRSVESAVDELRGLVGALQSIARSLQSVSGTGY